MTKCAGFSCLSGSCIEFLQYGKKLVALLTAQGNQPLPLCGIGQKEFVYSQLYLNWK